jgi:hypothetical protein
MTAFVGVGGVYKTMAAAFVGVSGAYKTVAKGWVGVAGAWKVFYEALVIALPGSLGATDTVASPGTANATMTFNSDGTYTRTGGASGNWATPGSVGIGAGYDIRWTVVTGTLSTGTTGTWQVLSSNRTYGRNRLTIGLATATGTIEIRDAVSLSVLTTCSASLDAEVV